MASIVVSASAVKIMAEKRIEVIETIREEMKEKEIRSVMKQTWIGKKLGFKQKTKEEAEAIVDEYDLTSCPWETQYEKQYGICSRILTLAETVLIQGKKEMVLTDEDLYWLE